MTASECGAGEPAWDVVILAVAEEAVTAVLDLRDANVV